MKSSNSILASHTFEADYNDHFATPKIAYTDIFELLLHIATQLKKSVYDIIIYDPYYWDGKMKVLLNEMGFKHVINGNRDFYQDIISNTIPGIGYYYIYPMCILIYLYTYIYSI